MWSAVMFAPSSVRSRFSSRIFRLYGKRLLTLDGVQPEDLVRRLAHRQGRLGTEAVDTHGALLGVARAKYLDIKISRAGSRSRHVRDPSASVRTGDGKPTLTHAWHSVSRRLEDRHALHVVGHREQVEGADARSAVAVPERRAEVAGQGGRVAGDVRDRARPAARGSRRSPPCRRRCAAGPARRGRPARQRRQPHVDPSAAEAGRAPALGQVPPGGLDRAGRRLDPPDPAAGVGQRAGEQPDPAVEVEGALPRLRSRGRPARRRPGCPRRPGAPARSRPRRPPRSRPAACSCTVGPPIRGSPSTSSAGRRPPRPRSARAGRPGPAVDRRRRRVARSGSPPAGSGTSSCERWARSAARPVGVGVVAHPGPPAEPVGRLPLGDRAPASTSPSHSIPARRRSCSATTAVLSRRWAARPRAGSRSRRSRPGRRPGTARRPDPGSATSTSTASPRQNRSWLVSVTSTSTRSPGSACRTKITRPLVPGDAVPAVGDRPDLDLDLHQPPPPAQR